MPWGSLEPPPTKDMEELVMYCRVDGSQLTIDYDIKARDLTWGTTNTEKLVE